jgi:hypothetical protein
VTLEEIRIEFFFPMDEPTAQAFRGSANRQGGDASDRLTKGQVAG